MPEAAVSMKLMITFDRLRQLRRASSAASKLRAQSLDVFPEEISEGAHRRVESWAGPSDAAVLARRCRCGSRALSATGSRPRYRVLADRSRGREVRAARDDETIADALDEATAALRQGLP
jgi:hypothetical protein